MFFSSLSFFFSLFVFVAGSFWAPSFALAEFVEEDLSGAALLKKSPLIVLDPGHGGEDLGAVGFKGVYEKEVALNVARYLQALLEEKLHVRTLLTRDTDVSVPLAKRTEFANKKKADLFISIHANASERKNAHGVETYYLDNTDDKSSLKLATRENESGPAGPLGDLDFMISDLIQNAKLDDSIALAHEIQGNMVKVLSRNYKRIKNLGVKRAPFWVLVGAHMPCVLVEVSFMDHPMEGRRVINPRYQRIIAGALYRGVKAFLKRKKLIPHA